MEAGRSKPLAEESATALYAVSGGGDMVFVVPDEMILSRETLSYRAQ
jgi:hypothetical protein